MATTDPCGGDVCPFCGGCPARASSSNKRKRKASPEKAARADPGDEAAALRETVAQLRLGIASLQEELEAERGAASGAVSETMSMILRLQRERSEATMEARQFQRYAEERFAHDAAEVAALRDGIAQRDAAERSLSAQLRACRARLLQLWFRTPYSPTTRGQPAAPTTDVATPSTSRPPGGASFRRWRRHPERTPSVADAPNPEEPKGRPARRRKPNPQVGGEEWVT